MNEREHPSVRKVVAGLAEAGFPESAAGIRVLDDEVRTAALAAAALGIEVGAIANSLVFAAVRDGERSALLVMTSGSHRADQRVLAGLVGADKVERADAGFVRTHTGQAIGGVAPIGHPAPIRTLVDVALRRYAQVWAAGGHPKTVFPINPDGLVELTAGTWAKVSGEEDDR